ncbi:MAG: Hsp20/alpha crystallin family protein [Acidobacteriota bacterium]
MVKVFAPLVEMARLHNEINKIFESVLDVSPEESLQAASGWVPSVDILLGPSTLLISADLPGVDPAGVDLAVSSGQMVIRGDKPRTPAVKGARYHCLERGHGMFTRTIRLPVPVNTRQASAKIQEGLLTVSFPRVDNRRGQAVQIQVETGETDD